MDCKRAYHESERRNKYHSTDDRDVIVRVNVTATFGFIGGNLVGDRHFRITFNIIVIISPYNIAYAPPHTLYIYIEQTQTFTRQILIFKMKNTI